MNRYPPLPPSLRRWLARLFLLLPIVFGPGLGSAGQAGIDWTLGTMPANRRWTSITYADGKFVTVNSYNSVSGGG